MTSWSKFTKALPTGLALLAVFTVWTAGAVWSFEEQTRFAGSRAFATPWLLPVVIDGLAIALAGVAYAAALDARPAVGARLGTAVAVASSAASNSAWAWSRSHGDTATVVLAAGVPVAANLAFEVLLSELRRQVQRSRGLEAPVALPRPRVLRWVLAPRTAPGEWRLQVLALTAPPEPSIIEPAEASIIEPPPARTRPARKRTPAKRPAPRSIEALRAQLASSIEAGELPAGPSIEATRKALGISFDRARRLLQAGQDGVAA